MDSNNLYVFVMSKFLSTGGFKWRDPKDLVLTKYTCHSSKECVLKIDLEHPKELRKLYNDYPLAPGKRDVV